MINEKIMFALSRLRHRQLALLTCWAEKIVQRTPIQSLSQSPRKDVFIYVNV
jgi:hypothetical protein